MLQASTENLMEMLRQGKCEIALIRDVEDEEDEFVKLPFAIDTIAAVIPITHPLANRKTIPLRMLADENFLLTLPETMPYQLSMKAFELSEFESRVTYNDPEAEKLVDLVAKRMGVSLLLKQLVLYRPNPKTTVVDVTPRVATQISLCYLKDAKLSDTAKHFIKCAGL